MGVAARRVVPVRVFACIEQHPDNHHVTELSSYCESQVTIFETGCAEKMVDLGYKAKSSGDGQIYNRTATDQCPHGVMFVQYGCRPHGAFGLGSVLAEQVDELGLHMALAWNAAGRYQHQGFIPGCEIGAGLENHAGHVDDVRGQPSVTDRVFSDEFQKRRSVKVISTFKEQVLMNQLRRLLQQHSKLEHVSCVHQLYGPAEHGIFDAFVVRPIQSVRSRRLLDVKLQSLPAWKAALARDGQLCIAQKKG